MMSMHLPQTERTVIERISLNDAEFFVELLNTPDWIRFIGDRNVSTVDDARRYLQNGFLRCYETNGFGYYLVRLASEGIPVGICGFLRKPNLENEDFGFALLPRYYGLGLAFESCQAVLGYGVRTFGFSVLDAVTMRTNTRSKRLLEKLGFELHGEVDGDQKDEMLDLYRWRPVANARKEKVS